jgi:uroporphyrinogen-III decarboxylase
LPGVAEEFACLAECEDEATAAWNDKGVVIFSPAVFTIPYENFCGARSMKEFLLDLYRRPDKVQAAMDAAAPVMLERTRRALRARRPMAAWVGGWRSASEFLAPRLWERFVFPYLEQLVTAVVEEGVIAVLHFDANWTRDLERLRELPKAKCVLSLDGKTDIFKAKEVLGDHMCIMGDVHPSLLSLGTPKTVTEYCKRLLREVGPSGFILSSGCDVPPQAPVENVRAMVDSVQEGG